jgi:hypothetical protein
MKTENRIQQECVMAFHNKYPQFRGCLFAVPNGGARSVQEGQLFKQTGVIPGVSDLILLLNGKAWLFELKNEIGKQSAKQIDWQKLMESQGFSYFLIRDKDLFMKLVERIIANYVKI